MNPVYVLLGVLIGIIAYQGYKRLVRRKTVILTVNAKAPASITMGTMGVQPAVPNAASETTVLPIANAPGGYMPASIPPPSHVGDGRTDTVHMTAVNPSDYPWQEQA